MSFSQAHYSTGRVAASFTSTAMVPETAHEAGPYLAYNLVALKYVYGKC